MNNAFQFLKDDATVLGLKEDPCLSKHDTEGYQLVCIRNL